MQGVLASGSSFQGSILALTSITVNTGVVVNGRTLARNGAVTLSGNTITVTICPESVRGVPLW